MKKMSYVLLVLVAASLSACAPAYYEASYHDYHEPSGHVSVVTSNSYSVRDYRPVVGHHYGSIEVTLIAGRAFIGTSFHPIRLVIHDGDFVEVPIRNKRGKLKRVYAHYQRGDLHFDSGRHCAAIQGASRYKYDKRWDRGHRYDHISAGPDFDLRGYGLIVRKHDRNIAKRTSGGSVVQKNAKKRYEPVPRGGAYVVGHGPHQHHLESRAVSVGGENVGPIKRQVVVKQREVSKAVKLKDKKVAAGKNKRGSEQIVERSNVAKSSKRHQGGDDSLVEKKRSNKAIKSEKQHKNKYMAVKNKSDNEVDIVKNEKSKKGTSGDKVDDLVAMSGDERAGLIEGYDKMSAGSRTRRNK